MIGNIVFDGIDSLNYGVYVTDLDSDNAPDRIYQTETVPGRNGTLSYDTGAFNNITMRYPAFIYDSFTANIESYRNLLSSMVGYKRLEDSFHTDEYRLARFASPISLDKTVDAQMGHLTLEFDCKPQRFLKSGETAITFSADGSIANPTMFDAKPLIRIYGAGTVGIGSVNITFDGSTPYVDIDCELQDCYYNGANKNNAVTLSPNQFPVLHNGENGIVLGSGITSVSITPRWWRL